MGLFREVVKDFAKDGIKDTIIGVVDNLTFTFRMGMYFVVFLIIAAGTWYSKDWIGDHMFEISNLQYAAVKEKGLICPKSYAIIKVESSLNEHDLKEYTSACNKESRGVFIAELGEKAADVKDGLVKKAAGAKVKAASMWAKAKFWKKEEPVEE